MHNQEKHTVIEAHWEMQEHRSDQFQVNNGLDMSKEIFSKDETLSMRRKLIGYVTRLVSFEEILTSKCSPRQCACIEFIFHYCAMDHAYVSLKLCVFSIARQSIKLFYSDNPVKIVRGRGQYLYDEKDVRYLDCISNVHHGEILITFTNHKHDYHKH